MKKLIWVAAICLGLATSFAAVGGEKGTVCQAELVQAAVDQWKDLPKDYASFRALPDDYSKAVYRRLSDTERVALWQAHWQAALAAGTFNDDQRELIEEAARIFTAETFADLRSTEGLHYSATLQLVREFEERLKAFFDGDEMIVLFSQLGAVRTVVLADPNSAFQDTTGKLPQFRRACFCVLGSGTNGCLNGTTCSGTLCSVLGGCGFMMNEICDGECVQGQTNPCRPDAETH